MSDYAVVNFFRDQAISLGLPLVVDIVLDLISTDRVSEYRQKLIAFGYELTGKTETDLDDRIWKIICEKVLEPEFFAEKGAWLITLLSDWVKQTGNVWGKAAGQILDKLNKTLLQYAHEDVMALAAAYRPEARAALSDLIA